MTKPDPLKTHNSRRDLTTGPVAKTLLLFALPTLGGNILQSLNGSISAVYVGKLLGENAVAATSVANMVSFLVFSTIFGLSMATTILIGQAMGRRDIVELRRTIGAAVGMFFILGIAVSLLGYLCTAPLLRLLATPAAAYPEALAYLHMLFFGMPIVFISMLLQSALRGVGDSVTPLYNVIINVVLCFALNPLFIVGAGPIPPLGIAGAALAGVAANFICLLHLVWQIYAKDIVLRLRGPEWHLLKPDMAHLGPILAIGLPMGLSMIIMSASALVMMGLINREGVATVAAFGAANQVWSYIQMPAFAVGSAVSAMAAQNIGAGKWDRIDKIALAGIVTNLAMTAVLVGLISLFAAPFLGLFLPAGSAAVPIGVHIQWVVGWSFMLMGVSMVVTSTVRANGAVMVPLLILIFGSVVVRFIVGFVGYPLYGAEAIWWSFNANSIASAALALVYYRYGKWRTPRAAPVADPMAEPGPILPV